MRKEQKHIKEPKIDKKVLAPKQLAMIFHPASCRSIQNMMQQLRTHHAARNLAA